MPGPQRAANGCELAISGRGQAPGGWFAVISGTGPHVTTRMQPQTLKFKLVLYLTIALTVGVLLFTGAVAFFCTTKSSVRSPITLFSFPK